MMKWIFTGLIAASLVFGLGLGRMDAVSNAAITECGSAIQLAIILAGSMCLWSGMMRIAQRRAHRKISQLFAPVVRILLRSAPGQWRARLCIEHLRQFIGAGQCCHPAGHRRHGPVDLNRHSPEASNYMCMFVVLNRPLQVIPTTTALLQANAGSVAPMKSCRPPRWPQVPFSPAFWWQNC